VLSSAVHGASRDAAARLMRLARARITARAGGSPAGKTPVTEQDWSQVRISGLGLVRGLYQGSSSEQDLVRVSSGSR